MATKPASTYILDSTNSLYSDMVGCWPMLEGSGTTTADKTSNGNTATLTGGLTWGTPDSEGPNFHPSTSGQYLTLASNLTIPIDTSFSLAWACNWSGSGNDGIFVGDAIDSGQNFVWMKGSYLTELWCSVTGAGQTFTSAQYLANERHDYVLTAAYSSGSYTLNLYQDGVAATPITGVTAGSTAWKINAILNGFSSAGYSFLGQFEYLYVWSGRALASTDAATLSVIGGGNPYSILKPAVSASFIVTPSTLPANHAGSLTLTLTGTGTSWTSGSVVSIQNSVTGTTTVTKGTWTQSSGTAATLAVTTGAGTGTFTITVDGVVSPSLTAATASFAISPTSGNTGTTPTITATGTNTLWTHETASTLFTLSGGTGASISLTSVTSDTAATFTLTVGSAPGTLTITDAPTGDTASLTAANYTVSSLTGSPSYIVMEGVWQTGTWNGQAGFVNNTNSSVRACDGVISFRATIATLDLYCMPNSTPVRLMVDGVDQSSGITLSSSSVWDWETCWSGLDATAEHGYRIYTGGAGEFFYINQIRTSGGSGLNTTQPMPVRPLIAAYGDSVVMGQAGNGGDSTLGHIHDLSRITGYQTANCASGSEEVSVEGKLRTADVTSLANPKPSIVFVQHGQVDCMDSVTQSVFGAAYLSMIQAIRAGLPQVFIVCEALHGATSGDTSRAAYNTTIQAQVAALADRRIVYDTSIINNFNWAAYGDASVHFNAAGSLDVAQILAAAFAGFLPGNPAAI